MVPKVPKKPVEPAGVYHIVDDRIMTLDTVVDVPHLHSDIDLHDQHYWKREMLDMSAFHKFRNELNKSFSGSQSNALGKMHLEPRKPIFDGMPVNDKRMNKREPRKPKPEKLSLKPAVKEDEF